MEVNSTLHDPATLPPIPIG